MAAAAAGERPPCPDDRVREIMVHVEHDPVAVKVYKYNHRDDGIIHHYVDKFEAIYGVDDADHNLVEALVEKYGPIDLDLSGAPCQSYSGLDSSWDQTSDNAQYLQNVGKLIKKLDCIQSGQNRVLFLSENVWGRDVGDKGEKGKRGTMNRRVKKCFKMARKFRIVRLCKTR